MEIVKTLGTIEDPTALHPRRRVVVLRRADGHYTYAEQYHFVSEHEGEVVAEGWATLPATGIYATAAIAEQEARAAFPRWYGE